MPRKGENAAKSGRRAKKRKPPGRSTTVGKKLCELAPGIEDDLLLECPLEIDQGQALQQTPTRSSQKKIVDHE